MSSTRDRSTVRSAVTFIEESTGRASLFGHIAQQLDGEIVGDPENLLVCAAAAMTRVEQDIDHLWRRSMNAADSAMAERLAELSHALQRAALLLEHDDTIG